MISHVEPAHSLFCDFGRIRCAPCPLLRSWVRCADGKVSYVKIPQGHGKRAYGCCAFIQFYHRECAELAIATMHNGASCLLVLA